MGASEGKQWQPRADEGCIALTCLTTVTRQEGRPACKAAVTPLCVLVKLAVHCKAAAAAILAGPGTDCCTVRTRPADALAAQSSRAAEPSMLTLKACRHVTALLRGCSWLLSIAS